MDKATQADSWSRVDKTDTCWLWTGAQDSHGYGQFQRCSAAHRVAYELAVGPIPDGLVIDHRCRRILCVNPSHLEPVTYRENSLRGFNIASVNAAKTHCSNGHEFTATNTYIRSDGTRTCRRCRAERMRRYHALKRISA